MLHFEKFTGMVNLCHRDEICVCLKPILNVNYKKIILPTDGFMTLELHVSRKA